MDLFRSHADKSDGYALKLLSISPALVMTMATMSAVPAATVAEGMHPDK
jgi:hypothetical protein